MEWPGIVQMKIMRNGLLKNKGDETMGYESKLIVVDRFEVRKEEWSYVGGEVVAEFNMGNLPWTPIEIFQTPIDFDLYVNDEPTRKDCYGEYCKMAKPEVVADKLEEMSNEDNYRRYNPVIQMLRGFNPDEWDDLEVVHYGR